MYNNLIPIIYRIFTIMDNQSSFRSEAHAITRCLEDCQINISISNQPNSNQYILVRLINMANLDVFQLKIDELYLNETLDKSFSALFPLPQILFEEMKQLIENCSIKKNGLIVFNMSLGRKGSKELALQLKKRNIDKFDFLVERMMNTEKRHAQQIRQLKNQFSQYVIQLKRDVNEEIAELKSQLKNCQNKLQLAKTKGKVEKRCSSPINLTYDSEYDKRQKVKKEEGEGEKKKTYKSVMVKKQAQQQKNSQSVIQINSREEVSLEKSTPICKAQETETNSKLGYIANSQVLLPYERNLHGRFFEAKLIRNEVIVTKKGNNGFFNYISKIVIPKNKITIINATQVKSKERYIMYGICTEGILGVIDAFYRNQSIMFYSQSGWLYKNGQYSDSGTKIYDGDSVKLSINTKINTVSWTINNKKTFSTEIPAHMLQRDLYFVLMMAHNEDTVRLSIQ